MLKYACYCVGRCVRSPPVLPPPILHMVQLNGLNRECHSRCLRQQINSDMSASYSILPSTVPVTPGRLAQLLGQASRDLAGGRVSAVIIPYHIKKQSRTRERW